jgi:hypothetical protein
MRRAALALALALLVVACKKKPAPPPPGPTPSSAGSVAIGPPLPPPPWKESYDPLPEGTEPLHLVAVARDSKKKILSLALYGHTVWLSTNGTDALATGAGALEKARDPLADLPYRPGVHDLQVVGFHPHLFALRTQKKGAAEPTVLVLRDGHWRAAAPLPFQRKPIAFLAYGTGAIAVTGVHDPTQNPDSYFSGKERGTVLTKIDADGQVSPMPEPLDDKFIAWNGAWDATGISLIGAIAEETDLSYGPHWVPVGTHIFQLNDDGKTVTTRIQSKKAYHSIVPGFALYRNNGFTTSEPERFYIEEDNERWRPNGATTFRIDRSGTTLLRSITSNHWSYLSRSRFVGDDLYTIQGRRPSSRQADPVTMQLLRVGPNGKTELIGLPPVLSGKDTGEPIGCEPTEIVAGDAEELWIRAACGCHGDWWDGQCPGTFPAVFRRGGPEQVPIEL